MSKLKARMKRMVDEVKEKFAEDEEVEQPELSESEEQNLDAQILATEQHLEELQAKRAGSTKHYHTWVAGLLPNGDKIRSCVGRLNDGTPCGVFEKVTE